MTCAITLSGCSMDLSRLTDTEFLESLVWERSADPVLKSAASTGDLDGVRAALLTSFQSYATGHESSLGLGVRTLWSQAAFP